MSKIVLDTNILSRAVASPQGLASELVRIVISQEHLHRTSSFMLAELGRVLRYPRLRRIHGLTDIEIDDFMRSIQQVSLVVKVDAAKSMPVTRDKNDDPVIETAIRSKANFLCTVDQDIRDEKVVEHCLAYGISVLSDIEMMTTLRDNKK